MSALVTSVNCDSFCSTVNICVASSLVGVTMSTRMTASSFWRYNRRSRNGSTKAAVLPELERERERERERELERERERES